MIVTCPKCESKFSIASSVLAPEGKTVKCSECGEKWLQLPDPDELLEALEGLDDPAMDAIAAAIEDGQEIEEGEEGEKDEDDEPAEAESPGNQNNDLDDIPEGVKPILEDQDSDDTTNTNTKTDENISDAHKDIRLSGMIAAAIVILLITPLLLFKQPIMNGWMGSVGFYQALGLSGKFPGDGVVFDSVDVSYENKTINVSGQLINLKSQDVRLPLLKLTVRDTDDEIILEAPVALNSKILKTEETLQFIGAFPLDHPESKIGTTRLQFVLE